MKNTSKIDIVKNWIENSFPGEEELVYSNCKYYYQEQIEVFSDNKKNIDLYLHPGKISDRLKLKYLSLEDLKSVITKKL